MRAQCSTLLTPLVSALLVILGSSMAEAQSQGSASSQEGTLEQQVRRLSSLDAAERLAAVRVLGELGDPAAVAPLSRTAYSDAIPEIRGWALRSLHQIGTAEAINVVRAVSTRDPDERVRGLGQQLTSQRVVSAAQAPAPTAPLVQPSVGVAAHFQQPASAPQAQPQTIVVHHVTAQPDLLTLRLQRRAARRGRGLVVGGWVLFGLSYGPSFIAGTFVASLDTGSDAWPLFVPVVGPFISAAEQLAETDHCDLSDIECEEDDDKSVAAAFNILGGIMQIAAVAMLIPGYIRRSRATQTSLSSRRRALPIAVLPSGPGDGPGVSVSAMF